MKRYIIIILCLNFQNCFTLSYEKKFDPSGQKDVIHEFVKDRISAKGSVSAAGSEKEMDAQFPSVLAGEGRMLNMLVNSEQKKAEAYDSFSVRKGNESAVFAKDRDFKLVIGNDSKTVNVNDLELKNEELEDTVHYFAVFTGLYGTVFDIYYVRLKRSEEDSGIFIKQFYPKKMRFNGDRISWEQRSRIGYIASNTLFYAGYLLTVPLDIITGIFQVIFYLKSGGVK
ncbi:MAG TPA: hypothetical protein PL048_04810 [Leptospiraceae bacterium]|nr:hypothetical protein [Leptospiraceae bacterium]HMY65752.1 hypothetical protein [Leptospiraceae bacterium]HMZ58069.1 hypothetical protein [Leptospiraceae bacterium]HNF14563.1 hypothetical protein [Leptospiraceae bacterium]HNF25154.1 hypothetical protein [Leptospiraceae bacterium]